MSAAIRAMTTADIEAVDALEKRLFPVDAWPTAMFAAELAQPETRHYVIAVEGDGTVVGYAGLMCIAPVADVQTIAVVPEREGRGIGTRMLETLISEARARAATEIFLEVRADNPRARRLYEWFRFDAIDRRRRYYRDGADAIVMRRKLEEIG